MKSFGLTETKLFHFHRIFKNGGGGGVQANPLPPPPIRHCITKKDYTLTQNENFT